MYIARTSAKSSQEVFAVLANTDLLFMRAQFCIFLQSLRYLCTAYFLVGLGLEVLVQRFVDTVSVVNPPH